MAVKTEKELSEALRALWLKAVAAIELRNFGYAISLWQEIAVFALRTLVEENPRDVKVLHALGRLYHQLGDSDQEEEIYNQITAIDPLEAEALRLGKDASARGSMKRGGWTQAESYRDL